MHKNIKTTRAYCGINDLGLVVVYFWNDDIVIFIHNFTGPVCVSVDMS
jgi:hypothetical protein